MERPPQIPQTLDEIRPYKRYRITDLMDVSDYSYSGLIYHIKRGNLKAQKARKGRVWFIMGKDFVKWLLPQVTVNFFAPSFAITDNNRQLSPNTGKRGSKRNGKD